jgi:hypothetical protein
MATMGNSKISSLKLVGPLQPHFAGMMIALSFMTILHFIIFIQQENMVETGNYFRLVETLWKPS